MDSRNDNVDTFFGTNPTNEITLSKAILTGLFTGIIATIICMIYNIAYRQHTSFELSDLINVSSLIFVVNLIFILIGVIYYGFLRISRKGDLAFIVVFVLLTALLAWGASGVHRSDNPVLNTEFHHLLLAIVVIIGIFASFGIPFLYHNKKFQSNVL
jgi:hypothetical protein